MKENILIETYNLKWTKMETLKALTILLYTPFHSINQSHMIEYKFKETANFIKTKESNEINICLQLKESEIKNISLIKSSLSNLLLPNTINFYIILNNSCCVDFITCSHINYDFIIKYGGDCCDLNGKGKVFYDFCQKRFTSLEEEKEIFDSFLRCISDISEDKGGVLMVADFEYTDLLLNFNLPENYDFALPINYSPKNSLDNTVPFLNRLFPKEKPEKIIYFGNSDKNLNLFSLAFPLNLHHFNPQTKTTKKISQKYLISRVSYSTNTHELPKLVAILTTTSLTPNNNSTASSSTSLIKSISLISKKLGIKTIQIHCNNKQPSLLMNHSVDLFVSVGCLFGAYDDLDLNNRVLSVYEYFLFLKTFCGREWDGLYEFEGEGFDKVLDGLSGLELEETATISNEIVKREMFEVVRGKVVDEKSWYGLEINSGDRKVEKWVDGRKGIARSYHHEIGYEEDVGK